MTQQPDYISDRDLDRDLKVAAVTMGRQEIRYLVDTYYSFQDFRIEAGGQNRALTASGEPSMMLRTMQTWLEGRERVIQAALNVWSMTQPEGRWLRSITGVGPVIASGLMAHVEHDKTPSVSALWSFAGLNPTQVWSKGQKRPWNARLKVLCWKAGESFVKVSNNDSDFYGHLYAKRKLVEQEKNLAGEFAAQAKAVLASKKLGDDTTAKAFYLKGQLPPAHIHARAKRYAVKLFLSHYWQVMMEVQTGSVPSQPYAIAVLGHGDWIRPPGWPM